MKRTPHFLYYWEQVNNNVIEANVRTNETYRLRPSGRAFSGVRANEWPAILGRHRKAIGPHAGFPITRAQARKFVKTGIAPEFSFLNKWDRKA